MFPPGNQGHWSRGGGDTETGIGERMGMCEWQLSAEACGKKSMDICNSIDKCRLSILHVTGSWPTCLIYVPPRLSFLP